jgi:hypothetical protein
MIWTHCTEGERRGGIYAKVWWEKPLDSKSEKRIGEVKTVI